MIRLDLLSVGIVEETGGILIVMRSPEQARLMVIETGIAEGKAIVLEAEGLRAERPLTHDLLYEVIGRLGARVKEAQIQDFRDETYFARLVLSKADGGADVTLDARPSDAIALALKAGAPIYVAEEVMAETSLPEDRHGRFAELFEGDGDRVVH